MKHHTLISAVGPANRRTLLAGILALAFVVRVAAMLLLQTWTFPSERAFGYETGEIGYALANGQGFSWPQTWRSVGPPGGGQYYRRDQPVPTSWEAPIYPTIVGLAFWFFGSYTAQAAIAVELFQILLSLLSCYVLFRLGKLIFNEWTGLLAALILALYPASIHLSVQKVEYAPLLTLLGLLLIQRTIELSQRPGFVGSLVLGVFAGVATLVNPVIMAFYPFALLWFVGKIQCDWRNRLIYAVTIVGCCGAVMTPWLIRNYLVFDRFVFIRPNFTRELVISSFPQDARALASSNREAVGGDDGEMSALFDRKAVELILQKPREFLRLIPSRSRTFWTYLGGTSGGAALVAGTALFSMLCVGLAGVWVAKRQPNIELAVIYLLTMPLPFYVTWGSKVRFRFPVEPILILFASYAMTSFIMARCNNSEGHWPFCRKDAAA